MSATANDGQPTSALWTDHGNKVIWTLGALLVLGIVGGLGAKPAYRHFRERRGLQVNQQVEALITSGAWPDVGIKLRLANELAPHAPAVWRSNARYFTHFLNPDGIRHWQLLLESGQATLKDRLEFVRLAQDLHRLELAKNELLALDKQHPEHREVQLLAVKQLLLQAQVDAAVILLRSLLERYPQDDGVTLLAGRTFSRHPDLALRVQGQNLLRRQLRRQATNRVEAALALAQSPGILSGDRRLIVDTLEGATNASPSLRLVASSLRLTLEPGRREAILREQMQLATRADLAGRIEIADWFVREGAPEHALTVLPVTDVNRHGGGWQIRSLALAALERWNEYAELLAAPDSPMNAFQKACGRAVLASRQGKADQMLLELKAAIEATKDSPSGILLAARIAETARQPQLAIRALEEALRFPPLAHEAATGIVRLAALQDDASLMNAALPVLVRLNPGDHVTRNELCYWKLVQGGQLTPDELDFLRRLVAEEPQQPAWRATLALAELRQRRPEKAVEILEGSPAIRWETTSPRCRLVCGLAYSAGNLREASRRILGQLDERQLKQQERVLLGTVPR